MEGHLSFLGLIYKLIEKNPLVMLRAIKVALHVHEKKKDRHILLYVRYNKRTVQ